MSTRILPTVLRAAMRQAAGDLRPNLLGAGLMSVIIATAPVLVIGRFSRGAIDATVGFGPMLVASCIGAFGFFMVLQLSGETYSDRIGGALLRVRILPHGPLVWAIGKTISAATQIIVTQVVMLAGLAVFIEDLKPSQVLICLPLIALSAVALAPLGFFMGALNRGMYTALCSYAIVLALSCTSGVFFPLATLPRWIQVIQFALPSYWSGHLTRWALVGDPSWEPGGAFAPALAAGVLAAWTVIGFALAPLVVRWSFRRESLAGLSRMQSTLRSQAGM